MTDILKQAAAVAAADLVLDGMRVGLGTGSTVAHLLPELAGRRLRDLRCVATSPQTEARARQLGLPVEPFDHLTRLDIAVDGADQVAPDGWLIKGGGGAHAREKVVAAAADRFVVIVDGSKVVEALRAPVPLELLAFGLASTLAAIAPADLRDGAPPSPDRNLIADYRGEIGDPAELAARLSDTPGIVSHGLFAPVLVHDVLIARDRGAIEHRRIADRR
jgi:ribose 5-phosphate isomerase A